METALTTGAAWLIAILVGTIIAIRLCAANGRDPEDH